jgi:hypothetical protein
MQLDDLFWILLMIVSQVLPVLLKDILLRLTRKNT